MLTEERKEFLDEIADDIDGEISRQMDFFSSDESNPVADYCGWGWREGDLDDLLDRAKEIILSIDSGEELWRILTAKYAKTEALVEFLVKSATLTFVGSIRSRSGEFYSMPIGQVDAPLPATIKDRMAPLSKEESAYVSSRLHNGSLSFEGICFQMDDERWCLVLDAEALIKTHKKDIEKLALDDYADWKKKVFDIALSRIDLTPEDISGDYRWRHLYDEGYSAMEAYKSWREDLKPGVYEMVKEAEQEKSSTP